MTSANSVHSGISPASSALADVTKPTAGALADGTAPRPGALAAGTTPRPGALADATLGPGAVAEVAVTLPVPGRYHYLVPDTLAARAHVGARVLVRFGTRKVTG